MTTLREELPETVHTPALSLVGRQPLDDLSPEALRALDGPGLERLARAASEGALHPEAVCDPIVSGLPAERHDDVCLLALALHDAAIPL